MKRGSSDRSTLFNWIPFLKILKYVCEYDHDHNSKQRKNTRVQTKSHTDNYHTFAICLCGLLHKGDLFGHRENLHRVIQAQRN